MSDRVLNLRGRGLRGESIMASARRSGAYGAVPTDNDAQVLGKFATYILNTNPNFKGNQGDPGGNIMAIGSFTNANTLSIPNGTDVVRTRGYNGKGVGIADYVSDSAVDDAYIAANPRTSFKSSNGRGFRLVTEGFVWASWLGVVADSVTDDSDALQASLDFMKNRIGGTLILPQGDIKISRPMVGGTLDDGLNFVTIQGCGGVGFGNGYEGSGTRIFGTHAGGLLTWVSCQRVSIFDVTFDGEGCSAILQTGSPTVDYLARLTIGRCAFLATLEECIYGNLIYETIIDNDFGVYGVPSEQRPGTTHRHIYCVGTGGTPANDNTVNLANVGCIERNRFQYANGQSSVYFENGTLRTMRNNAWELQNCTPIRVRGHLLFSVLENWFERNKNTICEMDFGPGNVLIDMSGLVISGNYFDHTSDIQFVVLMQTDNFDENGWLFDRYIAVSRRQITNNFTHLRNQIGEALITDASGAGLQLISNPAMFNKQSKAFDIEYQITWPTTTDDKPAVLGGYPFNAQNITFDLVGTTLTGGIQIATDKNKKTCSLYHANTLNKVTNAEMSGKLIYVKQHYTLQ